MRNKRFIIALTGAVVFGLIATVSVTRYLSNAQAYNRSLGNVVVTRFAVPLGAKISAEHLELVEIPNGSAAEGSFDSIDKVVGRVAITSLGVREQVTAAKLAPEGVAGGLTAVIPEGFRAMTVSVNEIVGVSGFVMPGSFVDIVCVIATANQQNQGPISKIVLQNIKVLASGSNLDQPKDGREAATNVRAVTLLVTPEQAEKLALAGSEGRLQLVMRNFSDQEDSNTGGATKQTLLGDNAPVPVPSAGVVKDAAVKPVVPAVRRVYPRRAAADDIERAPKAAPAPAPPVPRNAVEVIEGAKKRTVDLP